MTTRTLSATHLTCYSREEVQCHARGGATSSLIFISVERKKELSASEDTVRLNFFFVESIEKNSEPLEDVGSRFVCCASAY